MLTKNDLSAIKGLVDDAVTESARGLRTEIAERGQSLRADVAGLRSEIGVLRADMRSMEQRLTDKIEKVETGLTAKIGAVQEAVEILQDPWLCRAVTPDGILTSPYEILDYRSHLAIHDGAGMQATLVRKQRIRFLQDGVSAILDHAWGDGVLTTHYSNSAGALEGSINDNGRRHLIIGLKRKMHRGDFLDFEVRRDIMAALTTKTGWLETTIDHPIARLAATIEFPKDRPCRSAIANAGGRVVPLAIAQNRGGISRLHYAVQQPGRDVPHTIQWAW